MTAKDKGGRPRLPFDLDQLIALVRIQCTAVECAAVMKMTEDTIDRRLKDQGETGFAEFYKKHQGEGKASLRRAQWKVAQDGNPTMLIWLGKQALGQRDEQHLKHGGDVTPIRVVFETCYAKDT